MKQSASTGAENERDETAVNEGSARLAIVEGFSDFVLYVNNQFITNTHRQR